MGRAGAASHMYVAARAASCRCSCHAHKRTVRLLTILRPHTYIQIANVAVRQRWRRRGVGAALVRAAEARAERWGFRVVALHVDASNAGAKHFYARLGYKQVDIALDRKQRVLMLKTLHPKPHDRRPLRQ